jgi:hypothetical protein
MPRRRHPPPRRPGPPAKGAKPKVVSPRPPQEKLEHVIEARELFWNNVIREILTALSIMSAAAAAAAHTEIAQGGKSAPEGQGTDNEGGPLDGRLALVTAQGERIPIAEVYPLFACGIPGSESEKALSMAVECTVFQIRSPAGEVYTLPLHEIRGFHALSQELMQEIADAAQAEGEEPFGFAAFTSLARSGASRDVGAPDGTENLGPAL